MSCVHFVRSQSRYAAGPRCDQHARDDGAVCLNLDAVLAVAQQVTTAQHVLEKPKEDFDCPAFFVNQCDGFGRNNKPICRDTKHAVTVHSAGTAAILSVSCVRIHAYASAPHAVIRSFLRSRFGKSDDFITDDFVEPGILVAVPCFDRFPNTVVS